MLHKLNVASCRANLDWIMQLQRRLLAALCDPNVTSSQVIVDWVLACLPDLDQQWVIAFCGRKDKINNVGKMMLEHMQAIAAFPANMKQQLLNVFDNDQLFHLAFDPVNPQIRQLTDISSLNDQSAINTIRGFLESFYSPNFYANVGYRIPHANGNAIHFHKDEFLDQFKRDNPDVLVCPLCDGSLDGVEVDHFYPKSKYPSLSINPLNLVPICPICNTRANKGEQVPLTPGAPDPMADWFHPYLRPAAGTFQVRFEKVKGGMVPVLFSDDPLVKKRLDNLDRLVNLKLRWRGQVSNRVQSTQGWIRRHRERVGHQLTEDELAIKLQEWAENAEFDYGRQPHSIIATHYLKSASTKEPTTYDELWVDASKLDPVLVM